MGTQDFEQYLRQSEPSKNEKANAWQAAVGLQAVDGLTPSEYLYETAKQHIEGDITIDEVKSRIDSYYKSKAVRTDVEQERTEEADKVSARIAELLGEKAFSFTPNELIRIHRHLFTGIYKFAGRIRDYNISKKEWVLDGETVQYASAVSIMDTLEYDISQERAFSYEGLTVEQSINHICRFIANLWQIHPFGEGNTRTTAVFLMKYLSNFGFKVNNEAFAKNSWYFRNALVRANYTDIQKGIHSTYEPLERFMRFLLLGEAADLRNRTLHIRAGEVEELKVQSEVAEAKIKVQNEPINSLSLQELAVVKAISDDDNITLDQLSASLGKSRSTVKRVVDTLKGKGVLDREGARKNGRWILKS